MVNVIIDWTGILSKYWDQYWYLAILGAIVIYYIILLIIRRRKPMNAEFEARMLEARKREVQKQWTDLTSKEQEEIDRLQIEYQKAAEFARQKLTAEKKFLTEEYWEIENRQKQIKPR